MSVSEMTTAQVVRFWGKGVRSGMCLLWSGYRTEKGYGKVNIHGTAMRAHRVAYELTHGPIAAGQQIDHTCHNPACIWPDHLRATTQKQNQENRAGASKGNISGERGVYWDDRAKNWEASVGHNGKKIRVGSFATVEEAAAAVKAKRLELFTHNDADRAVA